MTASSECAWAGFVELNTPSLSLRQMPELPSLNIMRWPLHQKGASPQERQSKALELIRRKFMPALKDLFKPNCSTVLMRLCIPHFRAEHLREIVDLMIAQTQKRMKDQAIDLKSRMLLAACLSSTVMIQSMVRDLCDAPYRECWKICWRVNSARCLPGR